MWVVLDKLTLFLHGAQNRIRTGDLVLTKDVLCQLSYLGRPRLRCKKREKSEENAPRIFVRQQKFDPAVKIPWRAWATAATNAAYGPTSIL